MHAAHSAVCTLSHENNLIGRVATQVRNQMAVLPGKVLMYEQKSHCCESRSVRTAAWARQHYRSRTPRVQVAAAMFEVRGSVRQTAISCGTYAERRDYLLSAP